jgi:hypothetical protein
MANKKRKLELLETEDTSIENERLFFDDFQVPRDIWFALFKVEAAGYIYQHLTTGRLIMLIKTIEPNTIVTNGYGVHCQTDEDAQLARILEITVPRDIEDCEYTQNNMLHCLSQIDAKYLEDGVFISQDVADERNDAFLYLLDLVPFERERKVVIIPQNKVQEMEIF